MVDKSEVIFAAAAEAALTEQQHASGWPIALAHPPFAGNPPPGCVYSRKNHVFKVR